MSTEPSLNPCPAFSPFDPSLNVDQPPSPCEPECLPSQQDIAFNDGRIGKQQQCDPMQSGHIVPNQFEKDPERRVYNKYPKSIRGCTEAMLNLFDDIVVIDERGEIHKVPLIYGSQEKAVAFAIGENIRPDNSMVVDRVRLPLLSLNFTDISPNQERYTYHWAQNFFPKEGKPTTFSSEFRNNDVVFGYARGVPIDVGYQLTAWTYYIEDVIQILEQVYLKFSPLASIRVQGVQWETIVKLDGMSNLIDLEPGQNNRVVKFQFNMTVEHYIPQPVARYKTVLSTRVDVTSGDEVLARFVERV